MVDIPSFFNKPDFLGALLPGYIAVILGLVILFPELAPMEKDTELQLDFFSAVVFLVAGPAVGYTLRQIQIIFFSILVRKSGITISKLKVGEEGMYSLKSFELIYKLNESERDALTMAEARYFFNTSTGIVLLLAGAYFSYINGISFVWASIPLLIASLIFFVGAFVEVKESWAPQLHTLYGKYRNDISRTGSADAK